MSFSQGLKDFLSANKRERRGLSVLVVLLMLSLVFMVAIPYLGFLSGSAVEIDESRIRDLANQQIDDSEKSEPNKQSHKKTASSNSESVKLFSFDPNKTSTKDWLKLGFNQGQIKTIRNYLSKGGKFYKPADLSKIYTISQEQFDLVEPFISIPHEKIVSEVNSEAEVEKPLFEDPKFAAPITVNINSADTSELKRLKGIGSFYAKSIVQLREKLGGFHSVDQLMELWNFKEETLEEIRGQLELGDVGIRKIGINSSTSKELASHPYIDWKHANAIVSIREQHGEFSSIDGITKSHLISEELCQKIKPYLTLD